MNGWTTPKDVITMNTIITKVKEMVYSLAEGVIDDANITITNRIKIIDTDDSITNTTIEIRFKYIIYYLLKSIIF